MKYLFKIDRLAAWGLFISLLLYFISGYGMTKDIIDPNFASKMHLNYLTYFVLVFFIIHTAFAIHLAFKRWRFWKAPGKIILFLFYILFITSFIWVECCYDKNNTNPKAELHTNSAVTNINSNTATINSNLSNTNTNTNKSNTNSSEPEVKAFTLSELSQYDGQNGQPAYVAVDGIVYDMTSVFTNGTHYYHLAGQELTDDFYDRHVLSEITKYPTVGILE